jgi:hypothetical protein
MTCASHGYRPTRLAVALGFLAAAFASADYRNGARFDPGREMTRRAEGAPEELDRVTSFVGQWDVEIVSQRQEKGAIRASGQAEITFMNRGHGLLESFYSEAFDGHELAAVHFLGFNPASQRWFLAGADSWDEHAWVADGDFTDEELVFFDARRLRGGVTLTHYRYRFQQPAADALRLTVESSDDGGATFATVEERTYSRREASADFMKPRTTWGSPAPDRVTEAAAFDFLIGEWDTSHEMTFPNGQRAQWISNGTGVYALNGAAVMEFNWFDLDPSLPDAATTILRLYNRGMRRWETLFVPNRGHSVLYFGGVQEGDAIVLHPFEAGASGRLSRWVFHSIEKNAYRWYGETSTDRGETWTKSWLIDAERKPEKPVGHG